ncbi:MAG TPA: hypothetical protein VFB81_07345 [Myxococcales bacterium]|nr:hypothetical protein [Myxococcales bacterium]
MTSFSFFGTPLFIIYSAVGHLGLVLATGATAALAFLLRQRAWASSGARQRKSARIVAAVGAGAVAVTLIAGLRVGGTAFDPLAPPMFWEWITAVGAGAGVVAAAYAGAGALAAVVMGRAASRGLEPPAAGMERDEVQTALIAFGTLKTATERLRQSEQDAAARARTVADGVVAAEYVRAAGAIRHRLQLAEELQATAAATVLRLACAEPLRRLLERRPDAALARLGDRGEKAPLAERVEAAREAVRGFMEEIDRARLLIQRELGSAAGSVAQQVGLDGAERARPFEAAVSQLEATYGRVGHRLEALRLELGAEADAGAVAGVALALTGKDQPAAAPDAVAIALELSRAEQSVAAARAVAGAAPSRIAEVVVRASSSLARDSGDDEALADVIRSVRRELER